MVNANYICYDCETGGLDPLHNPITQYACVVIDYKTLKTIDRFETFVQPYGGLVIEREAIDGTMVRMSDIKNGITVQQLVDTIIEFNLRNKTSNGDRGLLIPIGHNIPFDNAFLETAFSILDKDYYQTVRRNFIDTCVLAKMTWGIKGDERLNLSACIDRIGGHLADAHGAMNDVEATADLFRWFVKRLRSKKSEVTATDNIRTKGEDFFEFSCKR